MLLYISDSFGYESDFSDGDSDVEEVFPSPPRIFNLLGSDEENDDLDDLAELTQQALFCVCGCGHVVVGSGGHSCRFCG